MPGSKTHAAFAVPLGQAVNAAGGPGALAADPDAVHGMIRLMRQNLAAMPTPPVPRGFAALQTLTAPVHRQGFAKAMKDIPGGSRSAAGQCRHLSRLLRRPPARASRTAVILMVPCRGPGWLTGPLSASSWIRSAIG
jgi:hypothetical protein